MLWFLKSQYVWREQHRLNEHGTRMSLIYHKVFLNHFWREMRQLYSITMEMPIRLQWSQSDPQVNTPLCTLNKTRHLLFSESALESTWFLLHKAMLKWQFGSRIVHPQMKLLLVNAKVDRVLWVVAKALLVILFKLISLNTDLAMIKNYW